jgi:muramidase (phage lysozyme)
MTNNLKAFLDMIAVSEIGEGLLAASDNGYNVIVGSTIKKPMLFTSYDDHPRKLIELKIKDKVIKSTAAGRYQLLARYFDAYKKSLSLRDFSPPSQDAIAIQQIRERRVALHLLYLRFATYGRVCRAQVMDNGRMH